MRKPHIAGKRALVTILVLLTAGNAVWSIASGRTAPGLAAAAYAAVTVLVLRWNDYRAGLIVGIAGFAIHVAETAAGGMADLRPVELAWLVANIVLPVLLAWFSFVLLRKGVREKK
jgi:hypothetical protein